MKKYLLLTLAAVSLLWVPDASAAKAKSTKGAKAPAAPAQEATAASGDIYGVVEIGASGVKALVVQTGATDVDPESPPIKVLKQYEPLDYNAVFKESTENERIPKAVKQRREEMKTEFKVTDSHFYLVGSSGLPAAVKATISAATFDQATIEYITPEQEATLVFQGIVPKKRLTQVVVLDVGSGNTKGAYVERTEPKLEFATFALALGTKLFAEEITKSKGDAPFAAAAVRVKTDSLLPKVQNATRDYPGLQNRKRAYLAGGITWVLATTMHPEQIGPDKNGKESDWVKITTKDIRDFYSTATTDPSFLLKPNFEGVRPENKKRVEEEFTRMSKVFNPDQLMAGAFIMKSFMDEMNFDKKDAVFFSRRALYAWPLGYVLEKIGAKKD